MAKQNLSNKTNRFRTQKLQNIKQSKNLRMKNGIKKRLSTSKVQDARQKLLQKKRKTVVDARDILAKMAKTRDARSKINRIRDGRTGLSSSSGNVKIIGSNILRKTDPNGKISLVTNKTKHKSDINLAIQKQLGLISSPRSPVKKVPPKRNASVNTIRNPVQIRKTILNDMDYSTAETLRVYDPALYKWTRPELRTTASQMINSLETTRQAMREALREELGNGWQNYVTPKPLRMQPSGYIDLDAVDDEEMPLVQTRSRMTLQGTSRISNVHSRLDSMPAISESHGIFSQAKTKVVVPAGHRIVVSNLQPTVTQDDIKELFEDIGQLLAAKLVRPGVAEVIYKNLKDAQKAVDTYHNRQLDGQPMKCLLVNKRPLNQPTAMPLTTSEGHVRKSIGRR
ncbi:polymerase delta-interacting protein 3 isoform X2 [Anoplophora glabripennis]|uniref:polymerase delta-interacting protein 3 isoform X2 n=1 Tax=Anoplophora glabripennis TaxID=217634 RepID=UPI0008747CF1|nr:polymerase delta-interacting protein 3 isoform X2 [Anoplophora glabripennis]